MGALVYGTFRAFTYEPEAQSAEGPQAQSSGWYRGVAPTLPAGQDQSTAAASPPTQHKPAPSAAQDQSAASPPAQDEPSSPEKQPPASRSRGSRCEQGVEMRPPAPRPAQDTTTSPVSSPPASSSPPAAPPFKFCLCKEMGIGNKVIDKFATEAEARVAASKLWAAWVLFRCEKFDLVELKSGGPGLPATFTSIRRYARDNYTEFVRIKEGL